MERLYKSFELKAGDNGIVEGYASTWTKTPDSYGDIVIKGAFTETLKKRKATGHPFPLCFNHDFDQIIGAVAEAEEDDFGLKIKASFLNTALAQEKRELVKEGIVWQFSFAYSVLGSEEPTAEEKKQGIYQKLTKLDLYEVSLVPVPANQTAIVTEVKNDSEVETKEVEAEEKSGRRNRKSDVERLKKIRALVDQLLEDEVDDANDDNNGEDEAKANVATEEPEQSNPIKESLLEYINTKIGGSEND